MLEHDIESNVVLVEIDPHSLRELGTWPWPRRYHATVLESLVAANADRIFYDVDFSSPQSPEDDAILAAAIATTRPNQLILPVFWQRAASTESADILISRPLDQFAGSVLLAAVNVFPAADGLIRTMDYVAPHGFSEIPTAASALAGMSGSSSSASYLIDYSITPSSFERISFSDLVKNRIEADVLAGKTVLVGASAVELGDMLPTPVHRSLPGIVVQALSFETLRQGPLLPVPSSIVFALMLVIAITCGIVFVRVAWQVTMISLGAVIGAVFAAAMFLQSDYRLVLDIVPLLAAATFTAISALIATLDQQTIRLFMQQLKLRRKNALVRSIVESTSDCIVAVNADGLISSANPATKAIFGWSPAALVGRHINQIIPTLSDDSWRTDLEAFRSEDRNVYELDGCDRAQNSVPVELSLSQIRLDSEVAFTAIIRDIRERRARQEQLIHQATHDPLTELPNRTYLFDVLDAMIAGSEPDDRAALMMLDLNRFKEVNDTLGHTVGDSILVEIGQRFAVAVEGHAFIARIGGDEFAVLTRDASQTELVQLTDRLISALKRPITISGVGIELGVSIGIAMYPVDADDVDSLLRRADIAMYFAKRHNSPYAFYDAEHDRTSIRKLSMVGALRSAIENDDLLLHYQPKITLTDNSVNDVEALARWQHLDLGVVSPQEFIPLAENTELIRPLTRWCLTRALSDVKIWRQSGRELGVAVNLSTRHLQDRDFPKLLTECLNATGASPDWLELEITESAFVTDPEWALKLTRELNEMGVRLSIDDFGTGYSVLNYLKRLPVDTLKIDKSFILEITESAKDRLIVQSTIQLAHGLGLDVVGEGVETEAHATCLRSLGCDYGQGFFYSKGLPAHELLVWLDQWQSADTTAHRIERPTQAAETA